MSSKDDQDLTRSKKNVAFKEVDVYYFDRIQGSSCVPHEGGTTLGMEYKHADHQSLSIAQHTQARKNLNDEYSLGHTNNLLEDDEILDYETEDWYYSTKRLKSENRLRPAQRRLLLRKSGVIDLDPHEATTCEDLRNARTKGGCDCKNICYPETCSCSLAGIQCFVEEEKYPCSCNMVDYENVECRNPFGHVQFSPDTVHNHFRKTMQKIRDGSLEQTTMAIFEDR